MQKITVADEAIIRKNNMKIFPWYKMLAWDLIFFYSIIFLFLVDVKGLTPAQVIITDAFYPLFKFILQPFGTIISNKLGKRKGIIFGNIMVCIYLVLLMIATDFYGVAFATAFCSLGFVIKNLCETNFLYESVPHCKNRGEIFGKIDKGASVAVFIGPEGGFEDEEIDFIKACQFKSVSISNLIYRAETAAISALSGVIYEYEL